MTKKVSFILRICTYGECPLSDYRECLLSDDPKMASSAGLLQGLRPQSQRHPLRPRLQPAVRPRGLHRTGRLRLPTRIWRALLLNM